MYEYTGKLDRGVSRRGRQTVVRKIPPRAYVEAVLYGFEPISHLLHALAIPCKR